MTSSLIDQFYSSGKYLKIFAEFESLVPRKVDRETLIVFGTHPDDNFTGEDIAFILRSLPSADSIKAEKSLGGVGHLNRAWFSSTFNRFILLFLSELRMLICKNTKAGRSTAKSQTTTEGIATGMAAWIATKFGVSDPVALGIAAAVLLSILYATKGAFCKMTDAEVEKSLKQRLPRTK